MATTAVAALGCACVCFPFIRSDNSAPLLIPLGVDCSHLHACNVSVSMHPITRYLHCLVLFRHPLGKELRAVLNLRCTNLSESLLPSLL